MSFDMRAKPFDLDDNAVRWVNDTFNAMTQEEKIAQLFVDMLWNDTGKQTAALLGRYPSGGLRYNNRKPRELYRQNAAAQKNSRIPLLIAANVEAGGNGAMTGGTKIGEGIACAATGDTRSAYEMGLYGCREAAAVGCNWTFAPVVDIDRNWRNCVIPTRCFGSDPDTVLEMALAYMKGANEAGVACCMKHFPGDGCDDRDQHIVTTVNDCTCEEWDASYGKVYQGMIGAGVPSIMVGHIQQPAYSRKLRPGIRDEEIMPATVAPELLQGLLREKLGFNGLIITDATHMVGLTGKMRRSEFLPIAVQSGCDMILYYRDHDEDLRFMREGLESGQLTQERLDEAVLRVLAFKAMLRLHEKQRTNALMPVEEGLSVIGCPEHRAAAARIIDRSITLVKNSRAQLPITPQAHKRAILYSVSSVSLAARVLGKADKAREYLAQELEKQGFSVEVYRLNPFKYLTPKGINGKKVLADIPVLEFRKKYDVVFVIADVQSFSTTNERNLHWSIPMGPEIPWYAAEKTTVFISVANPFHLYDVPMVPVCINTYNGSREAIRQAVEKITGKSEFKGNSPVDAFCGMWDTRL